MYAFSVITAMHFFGSCSRSFFFKQADFGSHWKCMVFWSPCPNFPLEKRICFLQFTCSTEFDSEPCMRRSVQLVTLNGPLCRCRIQSPFPFRVHVIYLLLKSWERHMPKWKCSQCAFFEYRESKLPTVGVQSIKFLAQWTDKGVDVVILNSFGIFDVCDQSVVVK